MQYYSSNDVYSRLGALSDSGFTWVSGNAWMLIYGDEQANAKTMVFVLGTSIRTGDPVELERARQSCRLLRHLAEERGLPFHIIEFDDEAAEIVSVVLDKESVSLERLKAIFEDTGLPVTRGSVGKAINSQKSSAYHQWQRDSLGAITVSDIDLVRMDTSCSRPIEVVELKRSFKPVTQWKPYPQDFRNFDLIVDVISRIGAQFTIAYNYHVKTPDYVDDASTLSLFEYPSPSGAPRPLGVLPFNAFVSGDYLAGVR